MILWGLSDPPRLMHLPSMGLSNPYSAVTVLAFNFPELAVHLKGFPFSTIKGKICDTFAQPHVSMLHCDLVRIKTRY
jgi:hypothetical protein